VKSTVEKLSPTRVRINVEVPFTELQPDFDQAFKEMAKQIRMPGFRPGKVPVKLLESRIDKQAMLDQVVGEAVPGRYSEAVASSDVQPLGQPEIEVTNKEYGQDLTFTAEVDIRPEITIPAFGELSVSVDNVEVTEDEVAEQLDELRARFGTRVGADRAAENGDFVSIDLSASVDGEPVPEASTTGLSYEVGSGDLVDGIDEAIVGASAGESRTFTTKLVAGEYSGRDADVSVTVQSVKVRELPEADDEFAGMASEFDTIDELRSDLHERLGRVKKMQQGVQARDKVLEALLEVTEVPLPEKILEAEVDSRKHDAIHAFDHDDARFAEFLESQGKTTEEFDTEVRADAEKSVKTQLILDVIVDEEKIGVNDNELTERIMYQAQRFGISPDEYVKRAQESGQLAAIFADVRRGKALASVVRQATVTDADGNAVDLEELFGRPVDPSQDQPAVEADEGDDPVGDDPVSK
jgi:trigger factor